MTRRSKLLALIKAAPFHGNKAAFARAIKRSPSQVSQWISGNRDLGDAGARVIEMALGLPQGYFDNHSAHAAIESAPLPYSAKVKQLQKKQDPLITEAVSIMESTDATGRAMALAAIKVALSGYKPAKANPAS